MVWLMAVPTGRWSDRVPSPREKPAQTSHQEPAPPHQVGRASWYGQPFHGRPTASGELFDMFQLTAAHRKLPLGTRVRVTHLRSRRSVTVRVNDRGPYWGGRIIDLSYEAARRLGMVEQGLAPVSLDLLKGAARRSKPTTLVFGGG